MQFAHIILKSGILIEFTGKLHSTSNDEEYVFTSNQRCSAYINGTKVSITHIKKSEVAACNDMYEHDDTNK